MLNSLDQYLEQFVGDVIEPVRGQPKGFQKRIDNMRKRCIVWNDDIEAWVYDLSRLSDIGPITDELSDYSN